MVNFSALTGPVKENEAGLAARFAPENQENRNLVGELFEKADLRLPENSPIAARELLRGVLEDLRRAYLEEKPQLGLLEHLKKAADSALEKLRQKAAEKAMAEVEVNLSAVVVWGRVLYAVCLGDGKIILRRKNKMYVLANKEKSATSGYWENEDQVVLGSPRFWEICGSNCDEEELRVKIENASDNSRVAAGFLGFQLASVPNAEEEKIEITAPRETVSDKGEKIKRIWTAIRQILAKKAILLKEKLVFLTQKRTGTAIYLRSESPRRHVFKYLLGGLILLFLLNLGRGLVQQRQSYQGEMEKDNYEMALVKYQEAKELTNINDNLALERLKEAKGLLASQKKSARQEKLAGDIEGLYKIAARINSVVPQVWFDLEVVKKEVVGQNIGQSKDEIIVVDGKNKSVYQINKKTKANEVKKFDKAAEVLALGGGVYGSNLYAIDKEKNQILKYVGDGQGNFALPKNYLTENSSVDFKETAGLAVDGSVWVLWPDCQTAKYTFGRSEYFQIKNLPEEIRGCKGIYTEENAENLYLLLRDKMIVVNKKTGEYHSQYLFSHVGQFLVDEPNRRVYLLSGSKILSFEWK